MVRIEKMIFYRMSMWKKSLIFEIKLYLIKIKPITKRGIYEIIIVKKRIIFLENLKISSIKKNITSIRDPKCA